MHHDDQLDEIEHALLESLPKSIGHRNRQVFELARALKAVPWLTEARSALDAGRDMDYQHPDRPDKVLAMLAAITQRVVDENTPPRWEAAMHVMERVAGPAFDVALAAAKPLARAMPSGAKVSAQFVQRIYPKMKRALGLN